jgi:hypothetical protein
MSRVLLLAVVLAGGLVVASGRPAAPPGTAAEPKTPALPRTPVQALLQTIEFKGFNDPKTSLSDALESLSKAAGVPIRVNETAFKFEMINDVLSTQITEGNPVPPMRSSLARVLQTVIGRIPVPSGTTYMVREDHIEVTTRHAQAAEVSTDREEVAPSRKPAPAGGGPGGIPGGPGAPGGLPGAAPGFGGLGGLGAGIGGGGPIDEESRKFQIALVSISLENQPFEDAVRQIRAQANINMVLDPALGEKAKVPLTVTLLNTPLDSAAMVLSELADLDFVWLDNVFFITTNTKAERIRSKWPNRRGGGRFPSPSTDAAVGM